MGITVIQPNWDHLDEVEAAEASRAFWANVDDNPGAVVVVDVVGDPTEAPSVFSSYAAAMDFATGLDACVVPKLVDVPDWGQREDA